MSILRKRKSDTANSVEPPSERERSTENVRKEEDLADHIDFSVFDIIRMAGGVVLFSLFISYISTGTFTYNTSSLPPIHLLRSPIKYISHHYITPRFHLKPQELSFYDGSDPEKPIYVAINGDIYDVSNSRSFYGPGGSYATFGGHEVSFALATNCVNYVGGISVSVNEDGQWIVLERELLGEESRRLQGWVEFFARKYYIVGHLELEEFEDLEKVEGLTIKERGYCVGRGGI